MKRINSVSNTRRHCMLQGNLIGNVGKVAGAAVTSAWYYAEVSLSEFLLINDRNYYKRQFITKIQK